MKTCPFCAEAIQDAAIVYRFCNRDVRPPSMRPVPPKRPLTAKQIASSVVSAAGTAFMLSSVASMTGRAIASLFRRRR